jgi:hypothetical protein
VVPRPIRVALRPARLAAIRWVSSRATPSAVVAKRRCVVRVVTEANAPALHPTRRAWGRKGCQDVSPARIYARANSRNSPFTALNDTTVYSGGQFLFQTNLNGKSTALPGVYSNNNEYYAGQPSSTWNPASGLGISDLGALANDLA